MKFFYLLLLAAAFSCSSKKLQPAYTIGVGEEFAFEIASNPALPYYWDWANDETMRNISLKSRVYTNPNFKNKVGRGGKELWTFEGRKKGAEVMKLHYRSYPNDIFNRKTIREITILVTVK